MARRRARTDGVVNVQGKAASITRNRGTSTVERATTGVRVGIGTDGGGRGGTKPPG
jgi:hypothetical protein